MSINIVEAIVTANKCYQIGTPLYPQGLMLHSIGCPQPNAAVMAQYYNQYQPGGQSVCVHGFIQRDGTYYQTLPYTMRAWHCGGAANATHIGVEMTEPASIVYTGGASWCDLDPDATEAHVRETYAAAVELFAQLCEQYAPTVASVANGIITALAPGSTKITATTEDGGFTAEYALTVKAATSDLLASYGYADNTRLSTSSGSEKSAAGYVTIGHTAVIPIDKTRYPNGATIRVTGAVNCLGNNWSGANNGGDSAYVLYTTGGTQFSNASYIEATTKTAGTFTIDADKTGFTLDIASLSAPHYIKFCVRGVGANLTATLTPK